MGLPAKTSRVVLLVFMNGMRQSPNGDYEIEGQFIRFAYKVMARDRLSVVVLSSDDPSEFEVKIPYTYQAYQWFDPSDPHDPKVKKINEPAPIVTQL
jgi:hypothetical protein